MPFFKTTSRSVDGGVVPGTYLQAFIKNGDHFFVTEIEIYRDGKIECWGLVDFEEFKRKVAEGWVRTRLPTGARVSMMVSMLAFTVTEVAGGVDEIEFVKEVADEIERLNGRPTSIDLCREGLLGHRRAPTTESLRTLREAYERVPAHARCYLGDMDTKDWDYRTLLGLS